jgi:hypothetical protein
VPAEADGAVHITPAAKAAAAPTVAINTLGFIFVPFLWKTMAPCRRLSGTLTGKSTAQLLFGRTSWTTHISVEDKPQRVADGDAARTAPQGVTSPSSGARQESFKNPSRRRLDC